MWGVLPLVVLHVTWDTLHAPCFPVPGGASKLRTSQRHGVGVTEGALSGGGDAHTLHQSAGRLPPLGLCLWEDRYLARTQRLPSAARPHLPPDLSPLDAAPGTPITRQSPDSWTAASC